MEQTLVLNAPYEPVKIVDWQRAITLWVLGTDKDYGGWFRPPVA